MKTLKEMTDSELLEEFEKAVKYNHYDYGMEKSEYKVDDLRKEMINRIGKAYHPLNDPD